MLTLIQSLKGLVFPFDSHKILLHRVNWWTKARLQFNLYNIESDMIQYLFSNRSDNKDVRTENLFELFDAPECSDWGERFAINNRVNQLPLGFFISIEQP